MPNTASMPLNAGSIIEYLNGSTCSFFGLPSSSCSTTCILPASTLVDLGVADPLDVLVAQRRLEHRLRVADAAQAEVADVGLGGDEGHRHLVADLAPAQVGFHDERELVGRPEARRALHRADDDRARIGDEAVPAGRQPSRRDRRGRSSACAVRAEPLDLVERELRPGGDDEVVVVQHRAVVELELAALRMQTLRAARIERDALLLQVGRRGEFDVLALAPVDRNPRIRRNEVEIRPVADDGDLVVRRAAVPSSRRPSACRRGPRQLPRCAPFRLLLWSRMPGGLRLSRAGSRGGRHAACTGFAAMRSPAERPDKIST